MKYFRSSISLIIVTIIIINLFANSIIFLLLQQGLKSDIRELIRAGKFAGTVETIEIPEDMTNNNPAFRFIGDDEFYFNGLMYDIVEYSRRGANIVFKCINDKNEEEIIRDFLESGNDESWKKKNFQRILKIIDNSKFDTLIDNFLLVKPSLPFSQYNGIRSACLLNSQKPPVPPPRG